MSVSYSISKINSYFTCPRQYKFVNIDKAVVEKPVSVEQFLGSAVHQILEKIYTLKSNSKILELEDALTEYHEIWEGPDKERIKITVESLGIDDYVETGVKMIRKYYDNYYPFDQGDVIALEKNVSFPLDPNNRYKIRAKIDRIMRRSDGVIEIMDYKTKRTLTTQIAFEEDEQMALYNIGVKFLWPDFENIELAQIYLRQSVEFNTRMSDDKLEEIRYRIYQKILEIEQAIRDDNFPPKETILCNWCVYNELCPAKRHKLALEDEVEDIIDAKGSSEKATEFLKLHHKKKEIESEMAALKEELIKYCEETELSKLETEIGTISVAISNVEEFPSKTRSANDYAEISFIVRESGIEECFTLDQRLLYKEFFVKDRLPEELIERLKDFLLKKRNARVTPRHKVT